MRLTQADIVRAGVSNFVRSEGEKFPPFVPLGNVNRDNMRKRRASAR